MTAERRKMKSRRRRGGSRTRRRIVRLIGGVETGGQKVLQVTGLLQVETLRCQRSNKGRRGGSPQLSERRLTKVSHSRPGSMCG